MTTTYVPTRTLGTGNSELAVPAMGLGCMGMSEFYGPQDDAQSLQTLNRSLDLGMRFLDSSDTYGLGHNESLLSQLITSRGRDAITLATKFGIQREPGAYARGINNDPQFVHSACEASLRRLGTDYIDLYYIHRVDTARPIEEPMQALSELVAAGKIGHIGLCEVSAETLRRAHAVHPVTAVQSEYSLWSRDPETSVLAACRELGVGFVAYSPLGRGFLTGHINSTDTLTDNDFRRANPRFSEANIAANQRILDALGTIAARHDASLAQLALAWVLAQGNDIVPIPGTRREDRLLENRGAVDLVLSEQDLSELDRLIPHGCAAGARYTEEGMKGINA